MNFDNLTSNMFGMGGLGGLGGVSMLNGGGGSSHQQLPALKKAHEVRRQ